LRGCNSEPDGYYRGGWENFEGNRKPQGYGRVKTNPHNFPLLFVEECLASGRCAVLAEVLSCRGSGPREPGAMLAVCEDGSAVGTVGGGALEASIIEEASKSLNTRLSALCRFDLSAAGTGGGDMVCGGQMEILVHYIDRSEPTNITIFRTLAEGCRLGMSQSLVTSISLPGGSANSEHHVSTGLGLFTGGHLETGSLDLAGAELLKANLTAGHEPILIDGGNIRYFIQPVSVPETVFIIGAGHVGKALADICGPLGFRTVIIDDRQEFANTGRFPGAGEILIISSYGDCFRGLKVEGSGFIVIVTRGHEHDKEALAAALRTQAGYIGMIASRRKRDVIYSELIREGVPQHELALVRSPIGIDIGAQTPAEIAVSIAAEMIAFRSSTVRNDGK